MDEQDAMTTTAENKPGGWASRLPFFYGWLVVGVAFITMAIGVNARTAFSLLFPPIIDEFGWSRATIAATFSIGFIFSTMITPMIGMMMDRFGPRLVIPIGATITSLGLIGATFATQPWHFYLTLGVMVVGGSIFMSYIGHTLFVPNWFDRRRGLAMGLTFSGVGIGSITLFPWMQASIQTDGWRESCLVIAMIVFFALVPLNIIFQRRKPQDLGLLPDGGPAKQAKPGKKQAANMDDGIIDHEWVATEWTLKRAMQTSRFWWLMLAFVTGLYVWYAVQVHQTRYLIEVGISAQSAAMALGIVGLAAVFGQIGVGWLSDRVGREWAWSLSVIGFLATYALLFVMRAWPEEWVMYLMVGVQGLFGYGAASVFGSIPAELFAGKRYGAIFGVLAAGAGVGAACGPWLTGLLYDITGSYDSGFALAIGVCALSIISIWIASPRKVRLVAGRIPVKA